MIVQVELEGGWHEVESSVVVEAVERGELAPNTRVWDGRNMSTAAALLSSDRAWRFVKGAAKVGFAVFAAVLTARVVRRASMTTEQRAIEDLAKEHEARGAEVAADHICWHTTPSTLPCRRRPDLDIKFANGRRRLIEVETLASVNRTHSIEQDRDLAAYAKQARRTSYQQVIADADDDG